MNIGIIGGADGPTSIYVASSVWGLFIIGAALLVVGCAITYLAIKKKK